MAEVCFQQPEEVISQLWIKISDQHLVSKQFLPS